MNETAINKSAIAIETAPNGPAAADFRPKILVADDESEIRRAIGIILRSDFDVTTVESGESAIAKIREGNDYDVVSLDLRMPGRSGVETLRAIKQLNPTIEVLIMTAHSAYSMTAWLRLPVLPSTKLSPDQETPTAGKVPVVNVIGPSVRSSPAIVNPTPSMARMVVPGATVMTAPLAMVTCSVAVMAPGPQVPLTVCWGAMWSPSV